MPRKGPRSPSSRRTAASARSTLGFSAAQRGNYQESSQTFQVLIDATVVGTFTPSGIDYAVYTTDSFHVTAGAHTITFLGLNPDGGDNTALIDQVFLELTTPAGLSGR